MKVIYLVCAYGTVYMMLVKFKATYDSNHDTFRIEFLLIPVAGLACLVNHEFSVLEVSNFFVSVHNYLGFYLQLQPCLHEYDSLNLVA